MVKLPPIQARVHNRRVTAKATSSTPRIPLWKRIMGAERHCCPLQQSPKSTMKKTGRRAHFPQYSLSSPLPSTHVEPAVLHAGEYAVRAGTGSAMTEMTQSGMQGASSS
jgi:hypothetical protein